VVHVTVNTNKYLAFKPLLAKELLRPILEKTLGAKERKLVYAEGGSGRTRLLNTTKRERQSFVLTDEEILQLARWAMVVERHYGRPMDMEWAKDGDTGELAIVQARPETVQSQKAGSTIRTYRLTTKGKRLVAGAAVGEAIAAGQVCLIRDAAEIARFRDGAILVTEATDPDWVPIMKRAAGIVTDHGGRRAMPRSSAASSGCQRLSALSMPPRSWRRGRRSRCRAQRARKVTSMTDGCPSRPLMSTSATSRRRGLR